MIEDLLEHLGIEDIRPLGDEIGGRCPMHEARTGEREHRPDNWSINRRSGAHHCWSCEYSGSLIRLIMDLSKAGVWEATQMIRAYEVELGEDETPWTPPMGMVIESRLEDFTLPPIRARQRRKLTMEAVNRYQLRWDCEESAWIIPILSPGGDKWGWQTKGEEIRNHPPGIKKGKTLFGLSELRGSRAVLVESPLDVAYLDTLSVPAVSSFGCQVSDMQMKLLVERCDHLVLALDNDKAGIVETRRIVKEQWHHRIQIEVFNYQGLSGKDPGELSPAEVSKGLDAAMLASLW